MGCRPPADLPTSKAVILLHEIYGINNHIHREHKIWKQKGFDVYVPELFPHATPYEYSQQEVAYRHFIDNTGFDTAKVTSLISELRGRYTTLLLVGYSVGATLAWLAARSGKCDGIICYYGSRIREYMDIAPSCPALILIARHEKSFNTRVMEQYLQKLPNVHCAMFDACHGFCDADSPSFNSDIADEASEKVDLFIEHYAF